MIHRGQAEDDLSVNTPDSTHTGIPRTVLSCAVPVPQRSVKPKRTGPRNDARSRRRKCPAIPSVPLKHTNGADPLLSRRRPDSPATLPKKISQIVTPLPSPLTPPESRLPFSLSLGSELPAHQSSSRELAGTGDGLRPTGRTGRGAPPRLGGDARPTRAHTSQP
jgi:hypothetical protein